MCAGLEMQGLSVEFLHFSGGKQTRRGIFRRLGRLSKWRPLDVKSTFHSQCSTVSSWRGFH